MSNFYHQWLNYNNWQERLSLLNNNLNKYKNLLDQQSYWDEEHGRINTIKSWNDDLYTLERQDNELTSIINTKKSEAIVVQQEVENHEKTIDSLMNYLKEFDTWKQILE